MPELTAEIIRTAFNLPPEKAVAFFERKGFKITWNWRDMAAQAHARAFTVAKVARMDVLVAIRSALDRALRQGRTFDQFQRTIEPVLKLAGWWGRGWAVSEQGELLGPDGKPFPIAEDGTPIIPEGARPPQLGSPHRLRTIFQTNLQVAYATGRHDGMRQVVATRPYWQYISVVDDRTTRICSSLHLKVFRADDPVWNTIYPPNHWRCRARVRSLSDRDMERYELTVSAATVKQTTVVVNRRTGKKEKTSKVMLGKETYVVDPAWNHNPATTPFTPDLGSYPSALKQAFTRETKP